MNDGNYNDFIIDICRELSNLKLDSSSLYKLTQIVNKKIIDIAMNKYSFSVWAHGIEDVKDTRVFYKAKEWLYDLICYEFEENVGYSLNNVVLVMESEWKGRRYNANGDEDQYGEVKFDFQKLLVSNAAIKLMVFRGHRGKHQDSELYEYFQKRILSYRRKNNSDTFIFVQYLRGFKECKIYKISSDTQWIMKEYCDES